MVKPPDDLLPLAPAPVPVTPPSDPAGVDLDQALRPRLSTGRRVAQGGAVLAALLVIVGLLLQSIGASQHGTASVLPSATPLTVIVTSNVTFGTLTVNDHALTGSPPLVSDAFHVGRNVVTLAAPPFRPRTCQFLLPSAFPSQGQPSAESGCVDYGPVGGSITIKGVSVVPDGILGLALSDTDLPPQLAASAAAAALRAVTALRPHTVVPTGHYYATGHDAQGHITAQRANAPLQAELLVGTRSCTRSTFCSVPRDPFGLLFGAASGQRLWAVSIGFTTRWRFTPPAGQQAILLPSTPLDVSLQLLLAYDGAEGWSVVSAPPDLATTGPDPPIQPLVDQLAASLCESGISLAGELAGQNGYSLNVPYDRGIEGCEVQLQDVSATTVQGTFLWRFGVLLAIDKGAHTLAPWLPIAPQAEVATVEG